MPHQCNISLKYSQTAHIALFKQVFSRYFLLFCVVEEISLVVAGNEVILGLIVYCVINMLLICYDSWGGFNFLLMIFELFAVDVKIMCVICRKNTRCYIILNIY